jgi:hypothetical protein
MTFVSGCASKPRIEIVGECVWVRKIEWTMVEGDAIVDHAPLVAAQLISHNDKVARFCHDG